MKGIRDKWVTHRDALTIVAMFLFVAAVAWTGGVFFSKLAEYTLVVGIVGGLALGASNDGYHALKRLFRDVIWPRIKPKLAPLWAGLRDMLPW